MKKPKNFSLKKWLYNNTIVGLEICFMQTGTDTTGTMWKLLASNKTKKKVTESSIANIVTVKPDYRSVLRLNNDIIQEVESYIKFIKKERKDLDEYERLKAKFE